MKKIIFTILFLLLIPKVSLGAIAYVNTTSPSDSSGTSFTFAHTTSGDNRLLIIYIYNGNLITGVTYGGVAMTKLTTTSYQATTYGDYIDMWYLVNPATGSNNVVVSYSSSAYCQARALTYTGVDQTNPIDAQAGKVYASATTVAQNITIVSTSWIIGLVRGNAGVTNSVDSVTRTGSGGIGVVDSNGPRSAGSNSLTAQHAGGGINLSLVSIKEGSGGGAPVSPSTPGTLIFFE